MKSLQHKHEVLKKILRKAYYEKERVEVGEQWHQDLMCRIRGLGPLETRAHFFTHFEQFFWRLTPATCFLIFIFVILLFKLDFSPEYDMLASLIYDTEEVTLAQIFEF